MATNPMEQFNVNRIGQRSIGSLDLYLQTLAYSCL